MRARRVPSIQVQETLRKLFAVQLHRDVLQVLTGTRPVSSRADRGLQVRATRTARTDLAHLSLQVDCADRVTGSLSGLRLVPSHTSRLGACSHRDSLLTASTELVHCARTANPPTSSVTELASRSVPSEHTQRVSSRNICMSIAAADSRSRPLEAGTRTCLGCTSKFPFSTECTEKKVTKW